MIRLSDLAGSAGWAARPAAPSPAAAPADLHDPSSWFDGDAVGADVRIAGDPGAGARGLTADQHAARVLAFLCGDPGG